MIALGTSVGPASARFARLGAVPSQYVERSAQLPWGAFLARQSASQHRPLPCLLSKS